MGLKAVDVKFDGTMHSATLEGAACPVCGADRKVPCARTGLHAARYRVALEAGLLPKFAAIGR